MSYKIKKPHRDSNHAVIVKALEGCCFAVFDTSDVGRGYPDLNISRHGRTHLVEIKREPVKGKLGPSRCQLSKGQIEFAQWWKAPVYVIRNAAEAIALSGKLP